MHDAPSVWPALAAFAAVVALIPIALWVLKRLQVGGPAGGRVVTLVGGLTLGPRERIAVIESHGRRWMIGVTGQSISLLAELDAPAGETPAHGGAPATAGAMPTPFSQLLDRMKHHG
jgi:flagellar protein FliO/FliZ